MQEKKVKYFTIIEFTTPPSFRLKRNEMKLFLFIITITKLYSTTPQQNDVFPLGYGRFVCDEV